ncbi:penicillin-binding protein 2 [Acidihalobacter prosperus]|uniref:Peptidoglycan D,D-transpeptidase MrdA n=1 Tax=Acidihalobacter prosperus TaxID=160660 RepID=A0A1A6C6E9_9GAMM|nr:penicillin-binding protein 2 [Acidihalobacter prosperus]OBS10139.1 penicillin-binding protein 2 [Acidihalobacter prosperus]
MSDRQSLRDPRQERRQFAWRALVMALVVVGLYGAMAARLIYLQVIDHEHYATLSHDNRVHIVAVPPPRGLIYDRHGVLLAENVPSYSLDVTPEQVPDMARTLEALKSVVALTPDDIRRFRQTMRRKWPFQAVPLRFDLSPEEVARFAVERYRFPGVDIKARLRRYYPFGGAMVDAVGYVSRIDVAELQKVDAENYEGTTHYGKTGIEAYYQTRLHGRVGYDQVEVNAKGRQIRVLSHQPPVPGDDLILSLDAGLQSVAEAALEGREGAAVAIDPRNGDVLAMVSAPSYDPNWFVDGISSKRYAELRGNDWRPLFNRALAGQYPPGSTIKPFMALAGLNNGVVTTDQRIFCGPYWQIPGDPAKRKYRDWNRYGHGMTDVSKAITQSVDVYFYRLAYQLGIERMHDFLSRFGLGRQTDIDTTGEMGGLLPTPAWKRRTKNTVWYPGNTVVAGIGQGFMLATPLQLADATAALSMRGERFRPRLLRAVRDPVTRDVRARPPETLPAIRLKDAAYWRAVLKGMRNVTQRPDGTAYRQFRGFDYVVAGKTGTAQVTSHIHSDNAREGTIPYRLRDNGLFIAFAPADHPLIAVAVVVEHGGGGDVSAAPVARRMIDYYLKHNTELRNGRLVLKSNLPTQLDLQPTEPRDTATRAPATGDAS